uniref:Protein phosphatase inhibitor 2 n=1 Tax=Megaselia scalaris TaxID=36166 RepID=T1GGU6_MEGSC
MDGSPEAKKPCKGILKTSSSFDRHSLASHRKSAKFDEFNVLQTYHPPDKDYGHMKIEEPKTPYNYTDPNDEDAPDELDAKLLAEKLQLAARSASIDESFHSSDDEDDEETPEQKAHRLEFEKRRKAHYKEFEAVKLARKLIEEEDDSDDDKITSTEDQIKMDLDKADLDANQSGST